MTSAYFRRFSALLLIIIMTCSAMSIFKMATAWSDGGDSIGPTDISYGTHDWIVEHALDLLPSNESGWLVTNRNVFLFGTEAPENADATFESRLGYGDGQEHHNYYNGTFPKNCLDDSASVRAQEEYQKASLCLRNGSYALAAWYSGAMCHYISDLGSWSHVISNATAGHASKYEELLNSVTDDYGKDPGYVDLEPAGADAEGSILSAETAYNAALWLGIGVYSDGGGWHHVGNYPASAMDSQFQDNWTSIADMPRMYRMRIGYSIRATIIAVAHALHSLAVESGFTSVQAPSSIFAEAIVVASVAVFGSAAVIVASARLRQKRVQQTNSQTLLRAMDNRIQVFARN